MSDKDISNMDFKELRSEVQYLRDELAIMQRKYEDFVNNIEYEIPYLNGKYTITEDLTLSGTVKWEMQNSPVKTQYSVDGEEWHDEQISGFKYMRMSFDGGQTWTNKTQIVGKDGSSANVTFAQVNSTLGNLFKKKQSGDPSELTSVYLYSPAIWGAEIYGCYIYAGIGSDSFSEMSEKGFDIWVNGARKVGIGCYEGNENYPYISLGVGVNAEGRNAGCVYKLGKGIWIGDASIVEAGGDYPGGAKGITDIFDDYPQATGIFIDLDSGVLWQYNNGSPNSIQ